MKRFRKVEIVEKTRQHHGRSLLERYEVTGFLQMDDLQWQGVLLKCMTPFAEKDITLMSKTDAMRTADEWFKISDEAAHRLVFGEVR